MNEFVIDSKAYRFKQYMSKRYPDIRLNPYQEVIAGYVHSFGRGAGMSFILNLLKEFDEEDE